MAALQAFAWFRERVVRSLGGFCPGMRTFMIPRWSLVPDRYRLPQHSRAPLTALKNQVKRVASTAWLGIIRPPDRSALPWHCLCSKEVEDDEDDIAERAVHFGGVAVGTARMVARRSSLAEYSACHHTRQTASPLRTSEFSPREVSAQTAGDNPTQPHRHRASANHPGGATPSQWHGPC